MAYLRKDPGWQRSPSYPGVLAQQSKLQYTLPTFYASVVDSPTLHEDSGSVPFNFFPAVRVFPLYQFGFHDERALVSKLVA